MIVEVDRDEAQEGHDDLVHNCKRISLFYCVLKVGIVVWLSRLMVREAQGSHIDLVRHCKRILLFLL